MKKLFVSLLTLAVLFCFCSCDLVIVAGTSPKADAATLYREGFAKLDPESNMNVRISLASKGQEVSIALAYTFDANGQPSVRLEESVSLEELVISMGAVYVDGWTYEWYEYENEVEKTKYRDMMDADDLLEPMLAYGPSDAVAEALKGADVTKSGSLTTFSCELSGEAALDAFASSLFTLMMGSGAPEEPDMIGFVSVTVNEEGYLVKIEETYTADGETATLVTEFPNPGETVVITAPADADEHIES